jgi:hypothetical protein
MAKAPYLKDDRELIKNLTLEVYLEDRNRTNKEIAAAVNKKLKEKGKREVSQSIFDGFLADIHERDRKGELSLPADESWTIGSTLNAGIPNDKIMYLVEIQKIVKMLGQDITIRQAKWFGQLYPMIKTLIQSSKINILEIFAALALYHDIKITDDQAKAIYEISSNLEKADMQSRQYFMEMLWLFLIGIQYAKQDQINELLHNPYPNTSELDNLYFVKADVSSEALLDGLWIVYATPEQKKQKDERLANFKNLTMEELEPIFGKLEPGEMDSANSLMRAQLASYVSIREWRRNHPKEWDVLSKRMEAKRNERPVSSTR